MRPSQFRTESDTACDQTGFICLLHATLAERKCFAKLSFLEESESHQHAVIGLPPNILDPFTDLQRLLAVFKCALEFAFVIGSLSFRAQTVGEHHLIVLLDP